ncbi:hypothetical protein MRB53_027536 [Persea americana]|uniref:Uncharacterized protein n=1 Tax=Persea americana TaxID=3435 RepID=A0ACC2LL51_PERAE|nr:hypothetical protein MRB53_027536 [Persea americana]|eukprot:TRINITY_DN6566_c0_g2_i1.p1 TRINITY_DN6566_c0_g2~~TRINITY_DN6566_c0_g2_i1.p1  ORF type:complete len:229 (-),score=23.56 TRINITY_DN6566_c0_g2_i1:827-1513(-)
MKNLYPKGKGKIHPTPSSSPSPSSVLNLLPAAILTLISTLHAEEAEVLSYFIFHSIKTDHPPPILEHNSKKCKKPPCFECSCFDCYTSFWTRWDSSPNRNLINQAIEAFEEHLRSSSSKKTAKAKKNQRRESAGKPFIPAVGDLGSDETACPDNGSESDSRVSDVSESERVSVEQADKTGEVTGNLREALPSVPMVQGCSDRGMVRKVWPDVLGLFNSRLWSLWSPGA